MPVNPSENVLLGAWQETLGKFWEKAGIHGLDGGTLRTFAEIEAESREIAPRFDGIEPGAVVAIRMGNRACWPAVLLALFRRGLIPLPLGQHTEGNELSAVRETCGVEAIVEADGEELRINQRSEPSEARQTAEGGPQGEAGRPNQVRKQKSPDADFLKLTSGTTSSPRAVRFGAAQLFADCDQICATMGIGPDDLNFGVIPFSHSYGFSNLLTPLICRGVPLVASDERLPRAILEGLAASGATVFPGIPVIFQKLADSENAPALPRLRLCISAGSPLPSAVGERFSRRFGRKIHTFYGSSECGGIAYDAGDDARYEDGFAGTAMTGVEITPLEDGRIAVRSAAVGDGYFPDADDAALRDGCFLPGDLVEWSGRGMKIVGRASEVINIAGQKLNPVFVEQCLLEFPGVRQAVLFGVTSALRGEDAVACVAGEGIKAAALLRFCRERLSPWQVPRDVWVVHEISANERGKVSRRLLAAEYLATRPAR